MSKTIEQALARAQVLPLVSESWRLDAELLLAEVLQVTREHLFTWPQQVIAPDKLQAYQALLARRKTGEPIAYILGRKAFWDLELKVNSHVLIPRPETELLVQNAIELMAVNSSGPVRIADLGTGSGAIALALARVNQAWQLCAVDNDAMALQVAVSNAQALAVDNIEFKLSSWCDGLGTEEYQLIVANPPYVAAGDSHLQRGDLLFEPREALVAGDDGLEDIREIVGQSRRCLKKDAWLLIEHGFDQRQAVGELLQQAGFTNIKSIKDYAGQDRLTSAQSD